MVQMKQKTIYYSPSYNEYFIDSKNYKCFKCKCVLDNMLFHVVVWDSRKSMSELFCEQCIGKLEQIGKVIEKRILIAVNILPEDSFPIFLTPPVVVDSIQNATAISIPLSDVPTNRLSEGEEDWSKAPVSKLKQHLSYDKAKSTIRIGKPIQEDRPENKKEMELILNASPIRTTGEQIDTERKDTEAIESK